LISFHEEKFGPFNEEAQPLYVLHWKELAVNQDKIRLDIDTERYQKLEDMGMLFVLTVRDAGKMVGYLMAFPITHMHYKTAGQMCLTDMFYILPEYRRGTGAKLFTEFERRMRDRGVVQIMTGCKVHQNHSELFKRLGWTNTDLTFVKVLI
jgi:L-amino acid N-acyltransferase YncA